MSAPSCKICGNQTGNKVYEAKEMMFGLKEVFQYMECGQCKSIQLLSAPEDMSKYYPDNYYSYNGNSESSTIQQSFLKTVKRNMKKSLLDYYLSGEGLIGRLLTPKFSSYYPWIKQGTMSSNSRILDIGCGSGELLLRMYNDGFRNLTGADPYIREQINYECGVVVLKKEVHELTQTYDVVMMHHAFEHMPDPQAILNEVNRILAPGGQVIIRIPIGDCYAWKKYGVDWVQLDAPRHFFLHTPESMELLAKNAGLVLEDILYDSFYLQFTGSEQYRKGIPLRDERKVFSESEIRAYNEEAAKLNETKQGDQACFYLTKRK